MSTLANTISRVMARLTGAPADPVAEAPAEQAAVGQNSAAPPEADRFARVASADLAAKHGAATGALPDLVGQWRTATLNETLIAMAIDDLAKQAEREPRLNKEITAEVKRGVADVLAKAKADDRPVSAEDRPFVEQEQLYLALRRRAEPKVKAYEARHAATAAARETLIAGALQAGRDDLGNKFSHLANIVTSDPAVRAKQRTRETLVFENKDVVVVADARVAQKVLVLPTRAGVSFLADLKPAELRELARVTASIERAIAQQVGGPSESWVNAPQDITQSHLHVHVQPKAAQLDAAGVAAMQAAVRQALSRPSP